MPRGEAEGVFKVHVQGAVHPARRGEGIGTALASAMVERGLAAGRERTSDLPVRLTTTGMTSNEAQAALLTGLGMRGQRWNFVMRTALDDLGAGLPLAEGYRFVPYDESLGDAVLDAHNAAFGGRPPELHPVDAGDVEAVGHRQPLVPAGHQCRGDARATRTLSSAT